MGASGLNLLREEWQKLVDEREEILRAVHTRKISFTEWNRRELLYARRVHDASVRFKHAQTREFCREMTGRCPN